MLPYLRRNRPERKRTCAEYIWEKKGHIVLLITVFGYLLFLNKQLYDEHQRTVAMEKQLQELTLERLHEGAFHDKDRRTPVDSRNANFGSPIYKQTQQLRGPQSIASGRIPKAVGTAVGAKKKLPKSHNEKVPDVQVESTVPNSHPQ